MAPADKKYWDSVAGENLRLYRMIQVGVYTVSTQYLLSIYCMHTVSKEYTQYLLTIYAVHTVSTLSTHYLNKKLLSIYTVSIFTYSIYTRYIYSISGEQRGRTAVTTTTLVTTTRGGAGVISLLFPWELFSPKLSP